MEKKKKIKKDKSSKKDSGKINKVNEELNKDFIKTPESNANSRTTYFQNNGDNSITDKTTLTVIDFEVEKNVTKNTKYNLSNKVMCHDGEQEECVDWNIDDRDALFPSSVYNLTNVKNSEIFERNMPFTKDEKSCEKSTSSTSQRDKDYSLKEFNKSKQFIEDMETFKKKKKKMDEIIMNIGNKNEKHSKEVDTNLNIEKKQEMKSPLSIEEKETFSYILKKQKKIEKYNLSNEEKDKYMKKYMLKLEEKYKKKKEEDLRKEIDENKEEIKKFHEKENMFLNYLKNPRLNLSRNEDLNDYLSISPTTIHFTDITKDETLTKDLLITNKSSTLLHIIIIPPASKHFYIKDIINVFNKNEENSKNNLNNLIAPGHSLKIKVCFNVFTLNQQEDQIKLLSEAGYKTVDIKAFQSMPKIKFDKVLNFGPTRPNERKKTSLLIKNEGKEVNILILPKKLFRFYEEKEKIEKEENIINLLIKKTEDSQEIKEIKENEDTYHTYNNVKSYSYNFLFIYKKIVNNFENLYFENVLQDSYYFKLKNSEEQNVSFAFKSNKIGIYEKDYIIVTDIECNFDELEDKGKYDFINCGKLNVFQFCIKAMVEPLLLNLLHINKNIAENLYEYKLLEYIKNKKKDKLSYFFYSNSLNSFKYPDIQVNSGYSFAEIEIINNGLIEVEISCDIYIKENDVKEGKQFVLDKENKGSYNYDELFDVTFPCCLYDNMSKGTCEVKESRNDEGKNKGNKGNKKKMKKKGKYTCPIYVYPRSFVLSYKKRKRIYVIFKPQEKHENYKNYYFILILKNLTKGSDVDIEDLLEIHKNRKEINGGFPLVCINKNKLIKNKKWNKLFGNNISNYENTSSSYSDAYSSYSELSEESLKKKQKKKKSYFNKKNKKRKFISLYMNLYANIIKPSIYLKMKKLSECFLLNPLHLYKTSFTIKNQNNFYVNYYFENLINLNDSSNCDKDILLYQNETKNFKEENKKRMLKNMEEKTSLPANDIDQNDENNDNDITSKKKKLNDLSNDIKEDCICYYDYFSLLNDIKLMKNERKSNNNKGKENVNEGGPNSSTYNTEVEKNKVNYKKSMVAIGVDPVVDKKNLKFGRNKEEINVPVENECYYNLNKKLIKYFYEKGNSDSVRVYVMVKNSVNKELKKGTLKNVKNERNEKNLEIAANLQNAQNERREKNQNRNEKVDGRHKGILKIEKGEYCLKPQEKKKITLYFLVNKYGYHEIKMNIIFYMGNYKIKKKVKGSILTKCKGVNIDKERLVFKNSYSHYCFCNVIKINNLDKDLKLINISDFGNNKYGFISLYILYLYAFKYKGKKKNNIIKCTDLLNNFKTKFYNFLENELDKNHIKKKNNLYNCIICKCFFKYDSCIDCFKSMFSNCNDRKPHFYYFNKEKYIVQNLEKFNNIEQESFDEVHFNKYFKNIYKYHRNKNVYIHNSDIEYKTHFVVYPSSLLLLPLRETFFLFFFFFSHVESISLHLNVNWNAFKKNILIEGESKNQNIIIKCEKKGHGEKSDMKKEKKRKREIDEKGEEYYIGICSDVLYLNVENLNELEISYHFCEEENNTFEYNYHKKKYVLINNCDPELTYYYKDFDSFMKINSIKNVSLEYCSGGKRRTYDKKCYQTNQKSKAEVVQNDSYVNEEGSKKNVIHGCIIMSDPNINKIKGKESKKHEFRLLIFHDDDVTKNKNFIKLKFSINLKYFEYREIIKVNSRFYVHTFDFILINENNLLLSLFNYMKKAMCDSKSREMGNTCADDEKNIYLREIAEKVGEVESKDISESFVNEMMEELNFIKVVDDKNISSSSNKTITENFKEINKFFNINLDENILKKFGSFINQMRSEFAENMEFCKKIKTNRERNLSNEIEKFGGDTNDRVTEYKSYGCEVTIDETAFIVNDNSGGNNNESDTEKLINQKISKLIWVHTLLQRLSNNIGCDFIDFVKRNKCELHYNYEKWDAIIEEGEVEVEEEEEEEVKDIDAVKNEKGKKKVKEKGKKKKKEKEKEKEEVAGKGTQSGTINLYKNYYYDVKNESDIIYIIISNKNKYNLNLSLSSNNYINDTINEIFHYSINSLITNKEWNGISDFINDYKLNKKECISCKNINLEKLNYENYNKLKHIIAKYKDKNEDYYYNYLNKILNEKNEYCLNLKNNFSLDFFPFDSIVNSMKSSFIKLYIHTDNINLYTDKITLNLSKRESICKISIISQIKSLHLLSHHKITKRGDACIFINSIFVNKEILKKYEELSKHERSEEVEKICKCFYEILKPYEITIFNSCNLRKSITWNFNKISYFCNKKNRSVKQDTGVAEVEEFEGAEEVNQVKLGKVARKEYKKGGGSNISTNGKYTNINSDVTRENMSCSSESTDITDENCEIRIENSSNYMNKKEKKKVKIHLENILHREGNHLYKVICSYNYLHHIDTNNEIKNQSSCNILNEGLRGQLSLHFYLSINIEKPRIMLLCNSKISHDKRVKFDFNYFNKKAYKRIDKMYKNQAINDILYEDVNKINAYFDQTFLKNKKLSLYFINQQDIHLYTYIYMKKFFEIKNIYIDFEEFDHSNTRINSASDCTLSLLLYIFFFQYHIKSKSRVCINLEINELKFKNEIKNNTNHNMSLTNKLDKKYIYEDFLTFQYLTSKNQQMFCIECHYNVSFLIMKENKHIFQEFNYLNRKNQKMEHCKELNEIENNICDKIKRGRMIYNEIEMRNNVYFVYFRFHELKMYKFCLFLFNTTKIPAIWAVKEEDSSSDSSCILKKEDDNIFRFSKTKDILFGKTYDVDNTSSGKDEERKNPFLFPDYIIVTFTPINKGDVTKKYSIHVADSEKIDFYLKGIYIKKNDEQIENC
ncbi:conserved Plasmodium protein, unknown function [Plasmodium malariae]|uniref:Uncharacterized protein n=1 Tax=Plasmodium malariae TaxID=5858 RepID=A0A1C3L1X4_PLAMA|nr:conserved Plasmodium protein, unknown function [Plasmodium malariae]